MGSALNHPRQSWPILPAVAALLVVAAMLAATPARAASNAACLLMGRVLQTHTQPLHEYMVQLYIQGVRSNNTLTNDIECPKVFKTGSTLWLGLNSAALKNNAAPRYGERLWLSLRYMENNGSVLRKYEPISRETYLEKKDGIQ